MVSHLHQFKGQENTNLFEESRVEDMVVTEVGISSGHAGVSFKRAVVVHTADDSWLGRIRACLWCLAANAEKIGEGVAVKQVGSVCGRPRQATLHVETFPQGQISIFSSVRRPLSPS